MPDPFKQRRRREDLSSIRISSPEKKKSNVELDSYKTFIYCILWLTLVSFFVICYNELAFHEEGNVVENRIDEINSIMKLELEDISNYILLDYIKDDETLPFKMLIEGDLKKYKSQAPIFSSIRRKIAATTGENFDLILLIKMILGLRIVFPNENEKSVFLYIQGERGISALNAFPVLIGLSLRHKVAGYFTEQSIPLIQYLMDSNIVMKHNFLFLNNTLTISENLNDHLRLFVIDTCTFPSPTIQDISFFNNLLVETYLHNDLRNFILILCQSEQKIDGQNSNGTDFKVQSLNGLMTLIKKAQDLDFIMYAPSRNEIFDNHQLFSAFNETITEPDSLPEVFLFSRYTPLELVNGLKLNSLDVVFESLISLEGNPFSRPFNMYSSAIKEAIRLQEESINFDKNSLKELIDL